MNVKNFRIEKNETKLGYEDKLFDTSKVHSLNIVMENWEEFVNQAQSEEYFDCTVIIDDETYKNVAIRGKGNTSLSQVSAYRNDRYSFKIEFDHYEEGITYHGLDKLCLNNVIQDNTYMKDHLTYRMMNEMGVAAPLSSFVYITVNGEEWGIYLAVEGVEDSFLTRNYGSNYGELYKPDSMKMGGGRGNGKGFDMEEFMQDSDFTKLPNFGEKIPGYGGGMPNFGEEKPSPDRFKGTMPGGFEGEKQPLEERKEENRKDQRDRSTGFGMPFSMGNDDVLLKYIDDNTESYSNIFDSAKTDINQADKIRLIQALKDLSEGKNLSDTVDIEAVIRYFVVHNFVLNFESYTGAMIHNYYLYENDGQMQMIPWDYNLAYGGFQASDSATNMINYPIDSPVSGGNTADRPMIAWILENEEYKNFYHTIFKEFVSEYFESGYFETMYDKTVGMIAPYVKKDPTKFCTYEEFEKGSATLREFCLLRAESIGKQLDGSIGSTNNTQDISTFVDAKNLQIKDMGSMGGMGGGMPGFGKDRPEEINRSESFKKRGKNAGN